MRNKKRWRRGKITLASAIEGWGDEAIDFDAQPQASGLSKFVASFC